MAERHKLMPAIYRWVVRESIAALGSWHRAHPHAAQPWCSINLSASAVDDDSLVPFIEQLIASNDLPADTFCFEFAESTVLSNLARTVRVMYGLQDAGCRLGVDDVGSTPTSLSYLESLPLDYLKIGGWFVRDLADDPACARIVSAINQIGLSMGMVSIAKHVDSERVLQELRLLDVGLAQGRIIAPPERFTHSDGRVTMPFPTMQACGCPS